MQRLVFAATLLATAVSSLSAQASKRDIELKARDGTRISATYFSAGRPGPAVMLLHMCDEEGKPKRRVWDNVGAMLAARGIHAIALDYRGYGESGGPRMEGAPRDEQRRVTLELWPGDIDAVFDHLVAQPGVNRTRVGAAGGSCGAGNAVQAAARHPGISTLVLLAGGETPAKEILPKLSGVPVFVVAARDDKHYDAVGSMRRVIGFSSNTASRLLEYSVGGHGTDLFRVHSDLEPMIAEWFVRHLVAEPVQRPR